LIGFKGVLRAELDFKWNYTMRRLAFSKQGIEDENLLKIK
jgi:hypothetical protein